MIFTENSLRRYSYTFDTFAITDQNFEIQQISYIIAVNPYIKGRNTRGTIVLYLTVT